MAAFDVKRVALVIALKGLFISCMAQTEPSNVCNSDDTVACRYDCPPESIQEHCASENEKDGYCCPGHYRTNQATCQVCPGAHVMPDVNNCRCSCLLCAECPRNDTMKTRCSITTDTVCYGTKDPTPRAHSACPWIETSSAPTTQVLTTGTQISTSEAASVNTPRDPQESKSEGTYKAGFFAVLVLFIFSFVVNVLLCIYICKRDKKQTAVCEKCQAAGPVGGQAAGQAVDEGDANGNIRNNNEVDDGPDEQVPLQAVVAPPQ